MNQVPEILERPDWDSFFLYHIYLAARKSRDTYTKIGAVFVRDNEIFSEGFNGMPRGVDDCVLERYDRPEKYFWFEHAERNAIYNCARGGRCTNLATCFTTCMPCADCARGLIQSGVIEVVLHKQCQEVWNQMNPTKWMENQKRSTTMFQEAKVKVRYVDSFLNQAVWMDGKNFKV